MSRRRLTKKMISVSMLAPLVAAATLAAAGCQGDEEALEQGSPETIADRRIEAISADLDLDADQRGRLEAVRDLVHERRDALRETRAEAVERHLEALESGEIDADEVHGHIDETLDEIRGTVHRVADELIALARSMNDAQRARAAAKLRTFHERIEALHDRIEAGGGHGAFARHLREHLCSDEGPEWLFSDE